MSTPLSPAQQPSIPYAETSSGMPVIDTMGILKGCDTSWSLGDGGDTLSVLTRDAYPQRIADMRTSYNALQGEIVEPSRVRLGLLARKISLILGPTALLGGSDFIQKIDKLNPTDRPIDAVGIDISDGVDVRVLYLAGIGNSGAANRRLAPSIIPGVSRVYRPSAEFSFRLADMKPSYAERILDAHAAYSMGHEAIRRFIKTD